MLNASIERTCNPQKKPSPKVAPDEYIIKIVGKRVRSVAEHDHEKHCTRAFLSSALCDILSP